MHAQRIALAIAATVGMLCTFLPWVNVPWIGAIYGTRGDGWITLALCAGALVIALIGDLRGNLTLGAHLATALIGVVVALVALWKVFDLNHAVDESGLGPVVSVGVGLYLLVVAGVAVALLPAIVHGSSARQAPPPAPWPPAQPYWVQPSPPGSWQPPRG